MNRRPHCVYQRASDFAPLGRIFHTGPWQLPYKAAALCPDGHWHMVQITGDADTYFSIPARAHYAGSWHRGYLIYDRTETGDNVLTFRADQF